MSHIESKTISLIATVIALVSGQAGYAAMDSSPHKSAPQEQPDQSKIMDEVLKESHRKPLPLSLEATSRKDDGWMAKHDALVARAKQGGVGVLFLGDSITEGMNTTLMHQLFGSDSANFGIGGDRTQNLLWRIKGGELDFPEPHPKLLIMLMGTNNLSDWGDQPATDGEVIAGIRACIKEIRTRLPDTKILTLGILPREESPEHETRVRIRKIDAKLHALADNKHVFYQDLGAAMLEPDGTISKSVMDDFLHPTAELGYEKMLNAIKPKADEILAHH